MSGGMIWARYFLIHVFAYSTVIAVFENIISFAMDLWGWSRKKASWINMVYLSYFLCLVF